MMITNFKPRTPVTKGVDVESPIAQAAEVAELLGASSFIVDLVENSVTLTVEIVGSDQTQYVVKGGQVVSVTGGLVSIQDRSVFYDQFEADNDGH